MVEPLQYCRLKSIISIFHLSIFHFNMSRNAVSQCCDHYLRKCSLVSPCCGKVYSCRFCHDEKENHKLVRFNVKLIECLQCGSRQEVSSNCKDCLIIFGKYFCGTCCLFDDRDKGQFHCDGCGICRVGGRDNFVHCEKCGVCLSKSVENSHQCVEQSSRNNCPICLEDLHTSTIALSVPACGHLLHSTCFADLLKSGGYTCPTCNRCLVDMSSTWLQFDSEIARTPMPGDYANMELRILCRDCHKHSNVKFHVIGLKCGECGSYNTSRDDDGNGPLNPLLHGLVLDLNDLELAMEEEDHEESETEHDDNAPDDHENTATDNTTDNTDDGSIESDLSLD